MRDNSKNFPPMSGINPQSPLLPGVNIIDLPTAKCKCGGEFFYHVQQVRVAGPIQTTSGRTVPVVIDCLACNSCNEVLNLDSVTGNQTQKPA